MIELAIEKAARLPYIKGNQRVYAIVSDKRGNILSESHNDYFKSSPHMKRYAEDVGLTGKIFWHAECRAIHYLPKNKKPYKITIARVNKHGSILPSQPCIICANVIRERGIKIVECGF
jgi:tRNA(Arg) A34 adenosine deaminase TadA